MEKGSQSKKTKEKKSEKMRKLKINKRVIKLHETLTTQIIKHVTSCLLMLNTERMT